MIGLMRRMKGWMRLKRVELRLGGLVLWTVGIGSIGVLGGPSLLLVVIDGRVHGSNFFG
jgi:hypothetical protein